MPDRSFLNWPFFENSHRKLAENLEGWADKVLDPLVAEEHIGEYDNEALNTVCRNYVRALGEAGFLKICVPAEYGGAIPGRLDVRSLCLMREGLSRRSGLADFAFAMQGLGTGSISLFGAEELKQRFLPKVARGERIAAFALSEKEAGSDPAAIGMTAERDCNDYVLNGKKTWISNAGLADQYVVFARTGEAPGTKGISAFVVDADTPGLSCSERINVIAPHPLGELTFEDVRIPASQMLGTPGTGFKVAMATLDIFRSTVGAAALGFSRRALDEAVNWCSKRIIGGELLLDKQLPQAHIADAAVSIDAAALLIYRAGWIKDTTGRRISRESSMAKLYATEEAQKVIDSAVQLLGGQGVVSGNKVEQLYREIRALRIYEGASDIQKIIIAGQTKAVLHT